MDTCTSSRSTANEVADVVGATSFNIVNNAWFNTAGADWLLNVWTALGLASHVLITDTGALLTAVCGRLPCGVDVVEDSSFVNATNWCALVFSAAFRFIVGTFATFTVLANWSWWAGTGSADAFVFWAALSWVGNNSSVVLWASWHACCTFSCITDALVAVATVDSGCDELVTGITSWLLGDSAFLSGTYNSVLGAGTDFAFVGTARPLVSKTVDLVIRVGAARFVCDTGWAAGISNDLKLLTSWTADVFTWLLGALDLSSDTHAVAASVIFLPDRSGGSSDVSTEAWAVLWIDTALSVADLSLWTGGWTVGRVRQSWAASVDLAGDRRCHGLCVALCQCVVSSGGVLLVTWAVWVSRSHSGVGSCV
jgi:hypothetical protein